MISFNYYAFAALASIPFTVSSDNSPSTSAVISLVPDNIDNFTLSGKPAFVEFYAPWCGHCKALAPVWEQLAQDFAFDKGKIFIAKVDADAEKSLGKRFGVQGFPTLKYFDGKNKVPEDYTGGRDLESLSEFITKKTGLRPRKAKTGQSHVVMLNDDTFASQVNGNKNVMVAFTASWCTHCKQLAPIWENVARDFSEEPEVIIAKVDAVAENSKVTAEAHGVSSYPTIKFFPKESVESELYSDPRSEDAIVAFLNNKSGTHRLPGGSLDASAGTVESFDTLVSKFTAGANIAEVAAEATKTLSEMEEGSRHWYAEYYVKVFQKLIDADDYATKEMTRLNKILNKGGLTQKKMDEFTIKTNILKKFSKKETPKSEL
ncbi:Protein disulfide-isomerase [Podosphaera aphanis]|nr:Protein disulfide-isomerase [Podosphaera aphanis]